MLRELSASMEIVLSLIDLQLSSIRIQWPLIKILDGEEDVVDQHLNADQEECACLEDVCAEITSLPTNASLPVSQAKVA